MKIRHMYGWSLCQHLGKLIDPANCCLFVDPYCPSLVTLIWHYEVRGNGPLTLSLSTFHTTSKSNMSPSSTPTTSLKQFLLSGLNH